MIQQRSSFAPSLAVYAAGAGHDRVADRHRCLAHRGELDRLAPAALVGTEVYLELFTIIADRRAADVFRFVGKMMDEGYDLAEFYRGLADFLRAMLIIRLGGGEAEGIPQHLQPTVADTASRFAAGDLLRMLAQVAELDADGRFRKSGEQRILIELLLLRFSFLDRTVEIEDVLRALGGGAPRDGDAGAGRTPPNPPSGRAAVRESAAPPAPSVEPRAISHAVTRSRTTVSPSSICTPRPTRRTRRARSGRRVRDATCSDRVRAGRGQPLCGLRPRRLDRPRGRQRSDRRSRRCHHRRRCGRIGQQSGHGCPAGAGAAGEAGHPTAE